MTNDEHIDGVLTFEATTEGIRVAVQSYFLNEQSRPDLGHFVWAYRIKISNESERTVQLLRRHWIITNGLGTKKEVRGEGVVGEKPVLAAGESFIYTSGTPLDTPTGFMQGSYEMQALKGGIFTIEIPAFSLDSPHMSLNIN